jgi:hypothetical protein
MVPEKGAVTLILLKLTATLKQKTGMREMAALFLFCYSSSVWSIGAQCGGTFPPFEPPYSLPLFKSALINKDEIKQRLTACPLGCGHTESPFHFMTCSSS